MGVVGGRGHVHRDFASAVVRNVYQEKRLQMVKVEHLANKTLANTVAAHMLSLSSRAKIR